MIRYVQGNLLDSNAEALVNAVNEVGAMGKGIALLFRDTFPESAAQYAAACARGEVRVGSILVTSDHSLLGSRWILHFPTKKHWRSPSRLEWVRAGLQDLVRVLEERGISSVALPALGCGLGGLDWHAVRNEIETAAAAIPEVRMDVYAPQASSVVVGRRRRKETE